MSKDHAASVPEPVRRAQLQMIWAHSRGGLVAATLFAAALAFYASGRVASELVLAWFMAKLAVSAARFWQGARYSRAGQPGNLAWRRATYRMLALDGFVWGLFGLAMALGPADSATLVAACLVGVSCIATFGLQARAFATACYVSPILALTAIGLLARLDSQGLLEGLGLLVVLWLQLRTAAQSERRFVELHALRLHADELAAARRDALVLAQRESAAKSQFLSNVSHELRTPLHGILGLARLIHTEVSSQAIKRRVELLESSGAHLLRLVNDLIEVGRLHTDQLPLRPRRFDLVYEIEALMGVYTVRAQDKSLGFTSFVEIAGPCWVTGDSARLRQVLHNVLSNAVKYTPVHGAITVRASYDSGLLRVECRDTGLGIPPEMQERVFAAFTQVDSAGSADGTGLGLTIAREVARAMGGDITLQSAVGLGSVFTITLALPAVAAGGANAPAALRSAGGPVMRAAVTRHVLVAEDDDVSATIVSAALQNLGLRVERVTNGADAIRHALRETERPDLVLMDCRMPQMDGAEATRAIRAQEVALGLSRVPVIAVTANDDSASSRAACVDAGMDDVLRKPFVSNELYAMLVRWLDTSLETAPATDSERAAL